MGVEEGNAAIVAGEAEEALELFETELARGNASGAVHEGIGRALYLMTDYLGAVSAHEQAYTAHRLGGDLLGAARAARMLAWMYGNMFGEWAVRSGWLGRARTLLADADQESAEHGWVLMLEAEDEADPALKENLFKEAGALARRHGDRDLEFEALGWLGLHRAVIGRVEEGLAMIDEALAAVVAGEVEDLWVVEGTFCGLFWACERFHDVARAEQWVRAAKDALERRKLVAVGAYCRAHYGGILTAAGRWRDAEVELSEAVRLFDRGYSALKDVAVIRLADLRVRQGRFEEAGRFWTDSTSTRRGPPTGRPSPGRGAPWCRSRPARAAVGRHCHRPRRRCATPRAPSRSAARAGRHRRSGSHRRATRRAVRDQARQPFPLRHRRFGPGSGVPGPR